MSTTIKAILFDADGVVILPRHFCDYLEQELHVTPDMTRVFFGGQFRECLLGRADLKETIKPFLPQWGWHGSVDAFLKLWFDVENSVDPRMVTVILSLRESGIICGLATNQERYRLEYMKREMGFEDTFDAIFSSAELGALKHERIYYELIANGLSLEPRQILFWDNTESHVETARDCGWQAEQFSDFEAFQQTLVNYVRRSDSEVRP